MTSLSATRLQTYHYITEYLKSLSETDKRGFNEGAFHIDDQHSFYVKNNTVFNEAVVHTELTALAITENVGGILLLFGWSNSNTVKDEHPTYNLFIELSEGELHTPKSKIQVIEPLLWMHKHDYVHLDIYNNNIFQLGDTAVIGDFDRSAHTADPIIKFQDLTHFYGWLPKTKITLFKHLTTTVLNNGHQMQCVKCEDKLLGILERNIKTERMFKNKFKDPTSQLDADANIAKYTAMLDECNAILTSPRLTSALYIEFSNAMKDISSLDKMPSIQTYKSRTHKSRTHKSRTHKSRRRATI